MRTLSVLLIIAALALSSCGTKEKEAEEPEASPEQSGVVGYTNKLIEAPKAAQKVATEQAERLKAQERLLSGEE